MIKLNNLSAALKGLGLSPESYLIKKLGRKYVEMATEEGLSNKSYDVSKLIGAELFRWRFNTHKALVDLFSREHQDVDTELISSQVDSCLDNWFEEYSYSIGADDTNIPPWLFDFLEDKIFPLIKEAFSDAIESLPADSETKTGLQDWLSRTTLEQLGLQDLSGFLGSGQEIWFLVHEIHHNILNHSAWKRFSELGSEPDQYNLLDAMEEGFVFTISTTRGIDNVDEVYQKFARYMAEFIYPILVRIIFSDKKSNSGSLLSQNWKNIDNHLAQIAGEEMGVKLPADKILFLKKVFETFKNNNDLESFADMDARSSYDKEITNALTSAILQVWSEPDSGGGGHKWDFLTGDDEKLLIDLMKNLDSRSGELLNLWRDSKKEHFEETLKVIRPCIEESLSED
jgi:hypothetical protein